MEKKKGNLRPGVVSAALRDALHLHRQDIPEWVYRMRKLGFADGYPPGYLEQAYITKSEDGLLQFHTDDITLNGLKDYNTKPHSGRILLDASKMIRYPGFNCQDRRLDDLEDFLAPDFYEFVAYMAYMARVSSREEEQVQAQAQATSMAGVGRRQLKRKASWLPNVSKRLKLDDDIIDLTQSDDSDDASPPSFSFDDEKNDGNQTKTSNRSSDSSAGSRSPSAQNIAVALGSIVIHTSTTDMKPNLDNFRKGIVPFESAEECVGKRGFFMKFMAEVNRKKTSGTT